MDHKRVAALTTAVALLSAAIASCAEAPTIPGAGTSTPAPRWSMQYPRLAPPPLGSVIYGTAADQANWAGAERQAALGDSTLLNALRANRSKVERIIAKVGGRSNGSTGPSFDLSPVVMDSSKILDSGTYPSMGGGSGAYVAQYIDYYGDEHTGTGDYKITTGLGEVTGDWAPMPADHQAGVGHYSSGTECDFSLPCAWRHESRQVSIPVGCGHDLWARGGHETWWSGTHVSMLGVDFQVIDPSAEAFTVDPPQYATGTACEEDRYDPAYSEGGMAGCPDEDVYEWYHWNPDENGYDDMGEVCMQDGAITII